MKKAGMENAYDITIFIINSILATEKILSEPELVKFTSAILASTDIDTGIDGEGDDVKNGYESPAESEKALDELDDNDPADEFSLGDLDIEEDADENLLANPMGF